MTHNRKTNTMHEAAMAMACGGGKDQIADDGVPLSAAAMHGSTLQLSESDGEACCGSECDCKGDDKAKSIPPRTTFTVGGSKPSPVKVPHENAGA